MDNTNKDQAIYQMVFKLSKLYPSFKNIQNCFRNFPPYYLLDDLYLIITIDRFLTAFCRILGHFPFFLCHLIRIRVMRGEEGCRVPLVFLTFVSRLTYECLCRNRAWPILGDVVCASCTSRSRESEACVRECHGSKSTWCMRIYHKREYERAVDMPCHTKRMYRIGWPGNAIIAAAHVTNRIFRPRIPFSILGESCYRHSRMSCTMTHTHTHLLSFRNGNFQYDPLTSRESLIKNPSHIMCIRERFKISE